MMDHIARAKEILGDPREGQWSSSDTMHLARIQIAQAHALVAIAEALERMVKAQPKHMPWPGEDGEVCPLCNKPSYNGVHRECAAREQAAADWIDR
jgi:hypothetical protein